MLAPMTRARLRAGLIAPLAASDMIKRMTAMLEWASQVNPAATRTAMMGSVPSAEMTSFKTELSRMCSDTLESTESASSIRPSPMAMRPKLLVRSLPAALNRITPTNRPPAQSHLISKAKT